MLKSIWRFLASVCSILGAHGLAFRFGIMSLETLNVNAVVISMQNHCTSAILNSDLDMKVVWEDKEYVKELGSKRTNDVKIPKHIIDIN